MLLPAQQKQLEIYLQKIQALQKNSLVFFVLAGVIVIGTLFLHSYPRLYGKIQEHKADIEQVEAKIEEQGKLLTKTERERGQSAGEYALVLEQWKPLLDQALPLENPTDVVTEFLEDFALTHNTKKHPMVLESIAFSASREQSEYMVLPLRMNIEADEYNFLLFMQQVSRSGSLNEADFYKSNPIPILSIESINIALPEEKDIDPALSLINTGQSSQTTPKVGLYSFNVEMHAYFRPPEPEEQQAKK